MFTRRRFRARLPPTPGTRGPGSQRQPLLWISTLRWPRGQRTPLLLAFGGGRCPPETEGDPAAVGCIDLLRRASHVLSSTLGRRIRQDPVQPLEVRMPVARRKVRRLHPHRRRLARRRSLAHCHGRSVYECDRAGTRPDPRLSPQAVKPRALRASRVFQSSMRTATSTTREH